MIISHRRECDLRSMIYSPSSLDEPTRKALPQVWQQLQPMLDASARRSPHRSPYRMRIDPLFGGMESSDIRTMPLQLASVVRHPSRQLANRLNKEEC